MGDENTPRDSPRRSKSSSLALSNPKSLRRSPRLRVNSGNADLILHDSPEEKQPSKKLKTASASTEEEKRSPIVSFFVGDPVPDEEARRRWPWRYMEKWALDINKFACESLKLNHPETQIKNESTEDFLDLLKEWDKLCKRYAVIDVEGATKSNIKLLRASQNNLYSKTDKKIPSGEYEVASLIDICYGDPSDTGKRGLKFQVRWVGYGPSEDTWEPIEGLSKCEDQIQDFVLKGFKAKILPRPGANFRDLSGVVVGADNVARRDPTAEPILLPSGRPLVPDYALNFCEGKSTRYCQIGNAVAIPVARALGYALGMAVQKLSRDEPLMTLPPKFSNSTTIQLLQSSTHGVE